MKINAEIVSKLNPCKNRFDNFKEQYPEFDGNLAEFVALDNITYSDKVWVAVRLLSKNQLVKWSIMCAESTKHIFNAKYPENKALDNLFDYMNSLSDFENLSEEQKNKLKELRSAAAVADAAAAYAAADAAAAYADAAADAYADAAAADAADAAADAAYADAAAAAYAAYAAADAAADAYADAAYAARNAAREEQNNLNLLFLVSLDEV